MGDRVNIVLQDGDRPAVVVYLHWGYTDRYPVLAQAIAHARPRWNDPSYCARMIISSIIKDDGIDNETNIGIYSATLDEMATGDFYTPDYVVVDLVKRTINVEGTDVPFDTFVSLARHDLP